MQFMAIGEFASRTRLSAKALRLYHELGLVVPAQVDPSTGYRLYAADQVEPARLVGYLRRADMPLALIASVLTMDGAEAALAVTQWWERVETKVAERRAVVCALQSRLRGEDQAMYDINVRSMPERSVLTISRHLHIGESGQFFEDAFTRLRAAGPGLDGIAGVPFLIFYGEVSEDSDCPIELPAGRLRCGGQCDRRSPAAARAGSRGSVHPAGHEGHGLASLAAGLRCARRLDR